MESGGGMPHARIPHHSGARTHHARHEDARTHLHNDNENACRDGVGTYPYMKAPIHDEPSLVATLLSKTLAPFHRLLKASK